MTLEKANERCFDRCNIDGSDCDIIKRMNQYKAIRDLPDAEFDDMVQRLIAEGAKITVLDVDLPEISSTEIRDLIFMWCGGDTMPHIKQSPDKLRRVLNAYELNVSTKLSQILMCSPTTAIRRIETPEDLTVRELRLIASRGHIPIEEIRGAL